MFLNKFLYFLFILCTFILILSGCSNSKESKLHKSLSREDRRNINYVGKYKIGKPYKLQGVNYKPKKVISYNEVGLASWYGARDRFHGKKTANGDRYDKNLLTAANRTLPLPCLVKVTNLKNNKSLILMVNDRGPASKKRIMDVSEKAADILGFKRDGITKVRVQYLPKESQEFLKKINLKPSEGAKIVKKSQKSSTYCSINCHVKLFNIQHKLAVNP